VSSVAIKIEGLDKAIHKLERLGTMKPVERGLKTAAVDLKGKVAVYPPVNRRPQPFKTDKQRRYFFGRWARGRSRSHIDAASHLARRRWDARRRGRWGRSGTCQSRSAPT